MLSLISKNSSHFDFIVAFLKVAVPSVTVLYVIIVGIRIVVLQNLHANMLGLFRLFIVIPLLLSLFNFSFYKHFVFDSVLDLQQTLAFGIAGLGAGDDPFKSLDVAMFVVFSRLKEHYFTSIITGPFNALLGGVIFLLMLRLYYIVGRVVLVGFIWTITITLIGVVPIFLLGFNETRGVFFSWLKILFTYFLYPIFAFFLVNVSASALSMLSDLYAGDEAEVSFVYSFTMMIFLYLMGEIINQIPNLANALAGGNAMQTQVGSQTGALISSSASAKDLKDLAGGAFNSALAAAKTGKGFYGASKAAWQKFSPKAVSK